MKNINSLIKELNVAQNELNDSETNLEECAKEQINVLLRTLSDLKRAQKDW